MKIWKAIKKLFAYLFYYACGDCGRPAIEATPYLPCYRCRARNRRAIETELKNVGAPTVNVKH